MRRREILLAAVAVAARPQTAAAQVTKVPTIGFLGTTTSSAWAPWTAAFIHRLRELGWTEGGSVKIEYRWAEGRPERFTEIAAEFVRLNVDVIITSGGAGIAAKQATSEIPIVFAVANDPVGSGLVASLAKPGGNVTGLSLQAPDAAGKRLEFLREILPGMRRLGIIEDPASGPEGGEIAALAQRFGIEVTAQRIKQGADIPMAFDALRGRADALYLGTGPLVNTHRTSINTLAAGPDWQPSAACVSISKPAVSCLTDRTTPTYSAAPRPTSIRSYAEQSQAICRSSNRPRFSSS